MRIEAKEIFVSGGEKDSPETESLEEPELSSRLSREMSIPGCLPTIDHGRNCLGYLYLIFCNMYITITNDKFI